jgi:prepilin-type N-terminal cleavage/methylation domain-containing protein
MTLITGRRSKRGFTLLELILVMLIVSLVAGLAAPSLHNFMIGRRNVNTVNQVLALGQYARARAAMTGTVYRLNADPVSRAYWLTKKSGANFVELGEEFGRHFTLPETMSLKWEPLPTGGDVKTYMDFYPDGRIDASRLQIVDLAGKVTEIGCRSQTEPLSILQQDGK